MFRSLLALSLACAACAPAKEHASATDTTKPGGAIVVSGTDRTADSVSVMRVDTTHRSRDTVHVDPPGTIGHDRVLPFDINDPKRQLPPRP